MKTTTHGSTTNLPDILTLSDTDMTLATPAEDIRGCKVVDGKGEDVGEVDDLMIDAAEKKVRFIRVASGGFLGMGKTKFLVPVDAISRIDGKTVHISHARDKFVSAPRYNPEVIDRPYLDSVYGYYGYSPFWGAGYAYPPYPAYPLAFRGLM